MGAWVHYENNTTYEMVYGKLYNGFAVVDQRGLCPVQWRVPTASDWDGLVGYLGSSEAGKKLKSTTGWFGTGNGTNASKFNGLPSGLRWDNGPNNVSFINSGTSAAWWSISSSTSAHFVVRGSSVQARMEWYSFTSGAAVRCVKE